MMAENIVQAVILHTCLWVELIYILNSISSQGRGVKKLFSQIDLLYIILIQKILLNSFVFYRCCNYPCNNYIIRFVIIIVRCTNIISNNNTSYCWIIITWYAFLNMHRFIRFKPAMIYKYCKILLYTIARFKILTFICEKKNFKF